MNSKPHFVALLTYLDSKDSKLSSPVSSGYRPAIQFQFQQEHINGIQNFIDVEFVFPGDTVTAEISLVTNQEIQDKLYVGLDFEFYEASILIGHGVITKLLF